MYIMNIIIFIYINYYIYIIYLLYMIYPFKVIIVEKETRGYLQIVCSCDIKYLHLLI